MLCRLVLPSPGTSPEDPRLRPGSLCSFLPVSRRLGPPRHQGAESDCAAPRLCDPPPRGRRVGGRLRPVPASEPWAHPSVTRTGRPLCQSTRLPELRCSEIKGPRDREDSGLRAGVLQAGRATLGVPGRDCQRTAPAWECGEGGYDLHSLARLRGAKIAARKRSCCNLLPLEAHFQASAGPRTAARFWPAECSEPSSTPGGGPCDPHECKRTCRGYSLPSRTYASFSVTLKAGAEPRGWRSPG